MNLIDSNVKRELAALLRGRVCVVGVGNRNRGDDGAGPSVIDTHRKDTQGFWIDAGMAPENFLEPISRTNPDTILIVDAVEFGGSPGECRLVDVEAMDTRALSTHAGSLAMLGEYFSARTSAQLRVVGIQPERIDAREGLSPSVELSVHELTAMLSDLLATASDRNGQQNGAIDS